MVTRVGNVGKPNFTAFQRLAGSGQRQNNEKNPGLLCTIKLCGVSPAGFTCPEPFETLAELQSMKSAWPMENA